MLVKGISYLRPSLLVQSPAPSLHQNQGRRLSRSDRSARSSSRRSASRSPAPIGVALATWLSEYGRPAWLARAVESAVEMHRRRAERRARDLRAARSSRRASSASSLRAPAGGAVIGQSFLTAGAMMSLLALPLIVGATREALAQVPDRTCARPPTRSARPAPRRSAACCCPRSARTSPSGVVLGMGRIIGDTAIVIILLGGTLKNRSRQGGAPIIGHAARHRLHADQLRLLQLARRRGQRAAEGLRRRVRAADDRAGAQLARDAYDRGRGTHGGGRTLMDADSEPAWTR